jgi:hypothetical protein
VISRHGGKRSTTLRFLLHRRALVEFAVQQIAPVCRSAGSFRVRARSGLNHVAFDGRIRGRSLPAGTYRIHGRVIDVSVVDVTVVIVQRASEARHLGDATTADACAARYAAGSRSSSSRSVRGGVAGTSGGAGAAFGKDGERSKGSEKRTTAAAAPVANHGHVLGASATKSIVPTASKPVQFVLFVILSVAILLLALGALPRAAIPHPGAAAFLTERRTAIAVAGIGALVAFLIAYALS